ncbi:MAG: hypothetical protein C5B50_05430 [Verrucomicrobia bacterium]|nr:MAG: hypothetical protein C5B50_05430 [Verrucomicrobiota bacterium]
MTQDIESLRKSPVVHELMPDPPRRLNAAQFFAHKDRLARLCIVALLASLLCNGLQIAALVGYLQQKDNVTVVDDEGVVKMGTPKPLAQAKELHQRIAFEATESLLLRNPRDFDAPELLQALFSRQAMNRASAMKAAEARQFDELQIEQKPLITRIDIRQSAPGEFRAKVTGELSRAGVLNEKPFTDALHFTLDLVMRRNPDLLRNRVQPLKIFDFTLNYETRDN